LSHLHSFPSLSSRILIHPIQVRKIGAFSTFVLVPPYSLKFNEESSLVLDLSITKTRGISIEVTVIGVPSCVTCLLFGLGFVLTTNHAIIGLHDCIGSHRTTIPPTIINPNNYTSKVARASA